MDHNWSNTTFQPVEKTAYTHTHTHAHTLQNNGQQYEQGIFLGPCVIGRLWLLGHWTTQKECDHWTIAPLHHRCAPCRARSTLKDVAN
jgi:hypothetical protein